jgi:hypothetical protein
MADAASVVVAWSRKIRAAGGHSRVVGRDLTWIRRSISRLEARNEESLTDAPRADERNDDRQFQARSD